MTNDLSMTTQNCSEISTHAFVLLANAYTHGSMHNPRFKSRLSPSPLAHDSVNP